jgi:hypothetical protein
MRRLIPRFGWVPLKDRVGSHVRPGGQPLGESSRACFCLIVSIFAFFHACCTHVVGSWRCASNPWGGHLARGYGVEGGQPRQNERQRV